MGKPKVMVNPCYLGKVSSCFVFMVNRCDRARASEATPSVFLMLEVLLLV